MSPQPYEIIRTRRLSLRAIIKQFQPDQHHDSRFTHTIHTHTERLILCPCIAKILSSLVSCHRRHPQAWSRSSSKFNLVPQTSPYHSGCDLYHRLHHIALAATCTTDFTISPCRHSQTFIPLPLCRRLQALTSPGGSSGGSLFGTPSGGFVRASVENLRISTNRTSNKEA